MSAPAATRVVTLKAPLAAKFGTTRHGTFKEGARLLCAAAHRPRSVTSTRRICIVAASCRLWGAPSGGWRPRAQTWQERERDGVEGGVLVV